MLLSINPKNPQPRLVQQVVELLENDGVIIYPTDTVYGLGCSIYSKKAMKRLHLIKKMDPKKPLTLICSNQTQIQEYTRVLRPRSSNFYGSIFQDPTPLFSGLPRLFRK